MITGATELMVHIGDPIAHARAPLLINPLLADRSINAVLVPMHVAPDGLSSTLEGIRAMKNCLGGIITMPHKVAVARLADALSPEARALGACNVIRRENDGQLTGSMLDGEGFVSALTGAGLELEGKHAFMAGAGGVALGIAYALAKHGAGRISIYNRTQERAEALRQTVTSAFPGVEVDVLAEADPHGCDVAINATALGMTPGGPLPMRVDSLPSSAIAAEVVISEQPTAFLAAASERGCRTQPGLAMLEAQIELMIAFMTGQART